MIADNWLSLKLTTLSSLLMLLPMSMLPLNALSSSILQNNVRSVPIRGILGGSRFHLGIWLILKVGEWLTLAVAADC
jgi:hypothetical protein